MPPEKFERCGLCDHYQPKFPGEGVCMMDRKSLQERLGIDGNTLVGKMWELLPTVRSADTYKCFARK